MVDVAGGGDDAHDAWPVVLEALLTATMPPSFGQRAQLQRPIQSTPLTRLVDAARPDPWLRSRLEQQARRVVALTGAGISTGTLTTSGTDDEVVINISKITPWLNGPKLMPAVGQHLRMTLGAM